MDSQYSGIRLLNVEQLSNVIGLAPGTIRNMLSDSEKTKKLPPRKQIPGINNILFSSRDVDNWINGLPIVYGSNSKNEQAPTSVAGKPSNVVKLSQPAAKRRGRPTKREQLERQQEVSLRGFC
ncbi:MAG: hypothetical protein KJ958_13090 [Gammaproteobacteria bacterium]|nr:hypothetical protein [Gammaproteobacteria bacterium]MBU1980094.1 hypothetical protein [Gammaproteobacteria bacterium]